MTRSVPPPSQTAQPPAQTATPRPSRPWEGTFADFLSSTDATTKAAADKQITADPTQPQPKLRAQPRKQGGSKANEHRREANRPDKTEHAEAPRDPGVHAESAHQDADSTKPDAESATDAPMFGDAVPQSRRDCPPRPEEPQIQQSVPVRPADVSGARPALEPDEAPHQQAPVAIQGAPEPIQPPPAKRSVPRPAAPVRTDAPTLSPAQAPDPQQRDAEESSTEA